MNFIYENEAVKALTFGDVEINQFFVNKGGYLCQKTNYNSFTVVANADGTPYSNWLENVRPDREITRIISKVRKIEF